MSLKSQLESLLFVSLKPLSLKELASIIKVDADQVKKKLEELEKDYQAEERGLTLIKNNSKYQLTSSGDNAQLVQEFLKDETKGELSTPSLETLTIIAYRGPIAKLDLEKIRGVNCSLILRNLLLRGLVEEKFNKLKGENYYSVSLDFICFLGLNSLNELPNYEKLRNLDLFNLENKDLSNEVEKEEKDEKEEKIKENQEDEDIDCQ